MAVTLGPGAATLPDVRCVRPRCSGLWSGVSHCTSLLSISLRVSPSQVGHGESVRPDPGPHPQASPWDSGSRFPSTSTKDTAGLSLQAPPSLTEAPATSHRRKTGAQPCRNR